MAMTVPGDINAFKRTVRGAVLQFGNSAYAATLAIDNGRISAVPLLVVQPFDAEDIARTVAFARQHQLRLTVLGGGHSAAGYCLNSGGVVLDMSGMGAFLINNESQSLHIGAGARWSDAYAYVSAVGTSLIPVGGGCPGVGVTGFTLGGGFSFVSRTYGLSTDQVIGIEMVMADGSLRCVGRDSAAPEDQDLFWACRGGGGGNFGIVTAFDVQLQQPRSEKLLGGQIGFPLAEGPALLPFYNEWVDSLPDEMAVYGFLGVKNGIPSIFLTPVFNGPFAQGVKLLQPLFDFKPYSVQLERFTLPEWEAFNDSFTAVNRRSTYIKSGTFPAGGLNADVVSIFERFIQQAPSDDSFIIWTHTGGKISAVAPGDTAFVHRETRFVYEIKSIWEAAGDAPKNVKWAREFGDALEPHVTGAYVNYIDPLLTDWARKYYGANYPRLEAVKQRVDPDNFFRFRQSIGSTYQPSASDELPPP